MLNIAILHYTCPPVVGGVEEIVRQQASLFNRYYHLVKIIAGDGKQFTNDYEIEINPLLSSRNNRILSLQEDAAKNLDGIRKVSNQIYKYFTNTLKDMDILIAHNVFTMPYNLPLTMALHKIADDNIIKVVSWNHDSPYFYKNYDKKFDKEPWVILKHYNSNVFYVTISESRAEEFKKLYNIQYELTVIPNGIDPIRFFRLDRNTVRLIQENNLFNADLILVHPSRLHPRKNIESSIHVIKALHEKGVKAKLLLTGAYDPHEKKNTNYVHKIKKLIETLKLNKYVIIVAEYRFKTGEKITANRITMRDLYQISDVLFMPSKQEGFGIPLLEAGMIKLPIVCSDIPPFKTIGGKNVCYFKIDEKPMEIAEKLLKFINTLKTHKMYRNVIHNHVWDNIYKNKLKPFLENIIQN